MKKLFNLVFFVACSIAIVWLGLANASKAREIEQLEAIKRQYEMVYLPSIGVNPSEILIAKPSATPTPSGALGNCSSCEELQRQLDDANNSIEVLNYYLDKANNRVEELEGQLENSDMNYENVQDDSEKLEQVKKLEDELETAKSDLETAEGKIKDLEEELTEAEEEIEKLENKLEKLSEEDDDDSSEVKNLKSDLKDAKAEIDELEEELAAFKKENKDLKSDNEDLRSKNSTLKSQKEAAEADKETFRTYWNDAEILAAEFGMELTTLKERNSELEKQLTEVTERNTKLEKQLKDLENWVGAEFDEETYLTVKFPEDGHNYMTTNKVVFYYDPTCTQRINFDYWNYSFRSSKIDYDTAENGLSVYVLRMENGMLVYCPQSKDYPYLVTVEEFWTRVDNGEMQWLLNEY